MNTEIDYTVFDAPEISMMMFYPQHVWSPPSPGAVDHLVPSSTLGVSLSARFFPLDDKRAPAILYFHGNGEVACEYDQIAPYYHEAGASLLVVDFRGYGRSGGAPSFSTMMTDASAAYLYFRDTLAKQGYSGKRYVKGRSLGAHSALEVAARHQGELAGLITESGTSAIRRMGQRFHLDADPAKIEEVVRLHDAKIRSVRLPFLAIHGADDEVVPVESAIELHDAIGSADKHLEIVPGAGHNDLLWAGARQYFEAVQKFIA
ncbi:MAG: alpha/beta hydrolase [Chloroflexi bacterium]|nr:alpha/beta hydrolase [Chloroflexota bacterium]